MDRTKQNLPNIFGSQLEFDTAKSVERSLYTTLTADIASEENIGELVSFNLRSLEEKVMLEALQFNATMQDSAEVIPLIASLQELEDRLNHLYLRVKATRPKCHFPLDWNKDDAPFLRFLIAMKGFILDRTFNDLKRNFEEFLKGKKDVQLHSRNILNPQLRYALSLAYGADAKMSTLQDQSSEELSLHLTNLVSKVLRRVLSEVLIEGIAHAMKWKLESANADFNVADKPTRKKILDLVLSKFSSQRITHSIAVALQDRLENAHIVFFKILDSLTVVNEVISNTSAHQLEEMAALYIPSVRHLVVQGFALQFLLNNGPLTLGPTLKATKHGIIHGCTGWPGEVSAGEFVVKVIEEKKVKPDVWAQTAVDLINTM